MYDYAPATGGRLPVRRWKVGEVIGERIRDKFAASRRKVMWMNGWAPRGFDIRDGKLLINEAEAALLRSIFERFARLGSATKLMAELAADGTLNKQGNLYRVLNNRYG